MADASKAHKLKLANSRKRFKELQELKKKKDANSTSDSPVDLVQDQTPVDSSTISARSFAETIPETGNTCIQLPNYFTDVNNCDNSVFFDNLQQDVGVRESADAERTKPDEKPHELEIEANFNDNYKLFNQLNPHSYVKETQQIIRPHADSNVDSNDQFMHYADNKNEFSTDKQNICDYFQEQSQQVTDAENEAIKNEIIENSSIAIEGVLNSNVHSLLNLSDHMAMESYDNSNSITDLEKRNIELATSLEQEKALSEQYKFKINELNLKVEELENERLKKSDLTEFNKLKEELQCHTQTIRLLVAEKAELSNSLAQLEISFKNKDCECSELQARLKASRSRAFEFEQELNSLKSEKLHKENNGHDQDQIIRDLQKKLTDLQSEKDELAQDLLEVQEKFKKATEELINCQKSNSELFSKLSLADVKIQQLSNADNLNTGAMVENLTQEKNNLEKEVATLNSMLTNVTKERNETTTYYQHYTEELNNQLLTLQEQYQQLQQENENLSVQEQNRIRHISDLERQLQVIQDERITFPPSNLTDSNLKTELEATRELCVQLQMEKTELEENYTKNLNENDMLLKELAAKNDSLNQLESMVEQLRGNQPDSVKLLATMESDKVAAARAVQQNKELKEQLESLTEVFAKMDNDKVELTEKLGTEQSSNKDLLEKLQKTELQLQRLTDAIEIKDRELFHLRETALEMNKQTLQHEQLTDRLRHYEAQDNASHYIQNELQEAKKTITRLTNELNDRKNRDCDIHEEITNSDEVSTLRKQLEELKIRNRELEDKNDIVDNNNDCALNNEHIRKEEAMKRLEDKVKRTMQDIADLTEEKQRLEHLVLQLQGETETIGEYVALYQHQRMILKQKALEKDQQLKQLASDREQIKLKLEKLNRLVQQLLDERGDSNILKEYKKLEEIVDRKESEENVTAAKEILTLLSEIKSSNLVEPKEATHHCPYCSGQLITV
ncbi:golgin subfamily A member 2 [Diorhabda carinulata]|uniref:golgin subfamily A member 2 n=1 Tax=Diorhabda carinulata TaxID=1163345 RepID=UPI0025A23FCE|nr:golgin subfamily A member 2 [Diorhabda carinulata]